MDNQGHKSAPTQDVSIIIALYNDWEPLNECLRSLATQTNAPGLEVIVVDDGSDEHAPHFIREWEQTFALTILRQAHQGISSARNRGVQASRNPIILFVDADCRFAKNCLSALISAMARAPEQHCFQLHLTGDCSTLVGRVEHLRLTTLQNHML